MTPRSRLVNTIGLLLAISAMLMNFGAMAMGYTAAKPKEEDSAERMMWGWVGCLAQTLVWVAVGGLIERELL